MLPELDTADGKGSAATEARAYGEQGSPGTRAVQVQATGGGILASVQA